MSSPTAGEIALHASLTSLRAVGTGAWLAGKRAHKDGPTALHNTLLAVTQHRETAIERGVLMIAPPTNVPQREYTENTRCCGSCPGLSIDCSPCDCVRADGQIYMYDGGRCRFWRTRDGRRWLTERHTKDLLKVPGAGPAIKCYYGTESSGMIPGGQPSVQYAGLARRAYSLPGKYGITVVQYLRDDKTDPRTSQRTAAQIFPQVAYPKPPAYPLMVHSAPTVAAVEERAPCYGSDEGDADDDDDCSPLEAALLRALESPLEKLAQLAIEEAAANAVWTYFDS